MAYAKTNRLNMRRVPSGYGEYVGVGGITDTLSQIGGGALNVFESVEQAKGAAAANQALLQQQMLAANQGIDTTTLLIGGVALAGVLFLVLRK